MDFSLKTYKNLLIALKSANYKFVTFEQFCDGNLPEKFVILRHDVDLKAENSLATAIIENSLNIKASYYFRIVGQSNKPHIIRQIAELNHEIGYHYEDLSLAKGDEIKAIEYFKTNLEYFRKFYPVRTICMHGSPTSKFDNRNIWKSNNYRDFGIIGEPYFDINFDEIFYLTDTGRSWDGERFSVRDKVKSGFNLHLKTTSDIINALNNNKLPQKIMITTHPQRWTDNYFFWTKELVLQTLKNVIKLLIIRKK